MHLHKDTMKPKYDKIQGAMIFLSRGELYFKSLTGLAIFLLLKYKYFVE